MLLLRRMFQFWISGNLISISTIKLFLLLRGNDWENSFQLMNFYYVISGWVTGPGGFGKLFIQFCLTNMCALTYNLQSVWGMGSCPFEYSIEGSLRLTAIHEVLERTIKEDANGHLYWFGNEKNRDTSYKFSLER